MVLKLGPTADAAAAHENELVDMNQDLQSPSPSSISFATIPLLGSLYSRYRSVDTPASHDIHKVHISASSVESLPTCGEESSSADPVQDISRVQRSYSKKRPPRPKTSYQLAYPVIQARYKRLKLRPKLLLQLQQVSHAARPLPVLDVLPSTIYWPKLMCKFLPTLRERNGLGLNDLVIVTSELYERAFDRRNTYQSSDNIDSGRQGIVATVCPLHSEGTLASGRAEICFNDGPTWRVTPLPNGSYEFTTNTEHGPRTVRWVLRGGKNRRLSAPPGGTQEDTKRFIFSMIDSRMRRHPVAATMTRNKLEVYDEYSIPSSFSASQSAAMSVVSDTSRTDFLQEGRMIATDDGLRTLIAVTSIWIVLREGWSPGFRYGGAASALHMKGVRPSTPSKVNFTTMADPRGVYESLDRGDRIPNDIGSFVQISNAPYSRIVSDSDWSRPELQKVRSKRSNSTSAASRRRSNRGGALESNGRPNRHRTLPKTRSFHDLSRSGSIWSGRNSLSTRPHDDLNARRVGKTGPTDDIYLEGARPARPAMSPDSISQAGSGNAESNGPRSKRRHRISAMFGFLKKKEAIDEPGAC